MIDLAPQYLEIVIRILQRHVPEKRVVVFGSRVTGKAKKFSDIDLAIMTDKPLSFNALSALQDDFSESNLPYRVDIVDWAATSQEFREVIKKNCDEIYTPDTILHDREK